MDDTTALLLAWGLFALLLLTLAVLLARGSRG
jgi:hypothetical protein